jgi:hypothetical protein
MLGEVENESEVTGQPPKVGQVVDLRADLIGQRAPFKTELLHLAGGRIDQTELHIKGKAVAAW